MNNKCFHCGLNLESTEFKLNFDNNDCYFCCYGCLSVFNFIVENGFSDYYFKRSDYGNKVDLKSLSTDFKSYDNLKIFSKFINKKEKNLCSIVVHIDGVSCIACTWLIERYISRLDGVFKISTNLLTSKANIIFDFNKISLDKLLNAFFKIGYKAYPYNLKEQEKRNKLENRNWLKKIIVSGLGMMQIMMLSASLYVSEFKDMHYYYWVFVRWVCFILSVPVILYSANDIFFNSYRNLKNKMLGMDFTISLSILIAFLASFYNLLINSGEVYFDSLCMFVFFILISRFIEMRIRHKSSDIVLSLQNLNNCIVQKIENDNISDIFIEEIAVGDLILVKPNNFIPVDGKVIKGGSNINESMLTGESVLIRKNINSNVFGGTLNVDNSLIISVTKTYNDSTVNLIVQILEEAIVSKPRLNTKINSLANYFTFFVILLTFIVILFYIFFEKENILNVTLSMLVVACPCALSLSIPVAMISSINSLVKIGFLITKEHTLDTLNKITDIVFDKTGTLTFNKFSLKKVKINKRFNIKKIISIASILEKPSHHPISSAFLSFKFLKNVSSNFIVKKYIGQGVEVFIDSKKYRLGKEDFINNLLKKKIKNKKNFQLFLADENNVIAYFNLENKIRNSAFSLVNFIKSINLDLHIISGDVSDNVEFVSKRLGFNNTHKNVSVKGKIKYIDNLIKKKRSVMMIGDGINDAPALNTSHLSVSMGSGSDLAKINSDAILLNNNLFNIAKALVKSKKTKSIINQNLFWAIFYNFTGLFLASLDLITPLYAAIGMSTSSLFVVLNSLRLKYNVRTK